MQPVLAKSSSSRRVRKVHVAHRRFEDELKNYLTKELKALRAAVPVDDLAAVLHAAKEAEIFDVIDARAMKGIFVDMEDHLVRGAAAGAKIAAEQTGHVAVLDATRPRIKQWTKEHAAELVKQLNETSRNAVRTAVQAGVDQGRHPRRLAQDIQSVIGLSDRDAGAVAKRREWLDGQVKKGEVSAARANALGDKYAEELLNQRAQMIARTETLSAVNAGRASLWGQLAEGGALPRGQKKRWDATADAATCKICAALGKHVPIGVTEEWDVDGVKVLSPPGHPGCRCTEILVDE